MFIMRQSCSIPSFGWIGPQHDDPQTALRPQKHSSPSCFVRVLQGFASPVNGVSACGRPSVEVEVEIIVIVVVLRDERHGHDFTGWFMSVDKQAPIGQVPHGCLAFDETCSERTSTHSNI